MNQTSNTSVESSLARVYRNKRPLGGTCPFTNRRKVKWLRILNRTEIERIWPTGQFGGRQTVSTIRRGADRLLKLLSKRQRSFARRPHLPIRPDMVWGEDDQIDQDTFAAKQTQLRDLLGKDQSAA